MTVLLVETTIAQLVVEAPPESATLLAVEQSATLVAVIEQGPSGPPGIGGGFVSIAAVNCGGHKAVMPVAGGIATASASNPSHLGKVIGVTTSAALAGDEISIQGTGEIAEPSWAWTVGPVYLGESGSLTQTLPSVGFMQQIGIAVSATIMVVDIGMPVRLL